MQNYKVIVRYDGTKYDGWQKQGNTADTIQGKLEAVLARLEGRAVEVIGSGRTDAGVHALGQTANFKLSEKRQAEEILIYMNQYLPEDIAVISIEEAGERFHSRFCAEGKLYRYRIHNSRIGNPFTRKYTWRLEEELDLNAMKQAAAYLTGTHDYMSFCSNKKIKKSTVRTVDTIQIERMGEEVVLSFHGDGFLYNMVRIMTGTLVEVGLGKRAPEEMTEILEKRERAAAGMTAPAQGLWLVEVEYAG